MSQIVSALFSKDSRYEEIRIGVVGCGRMGKEHARATSRLGAKISFFCDSDQQRSQELADQYPGSIALNHDRQINWESVDAVFICTPPVTRGPIEVAAIRAGVHVFMEKPIGVSADQCQPILDALKANPLLTSVGYMNRYRDSVIRVKRHLSECKPIGISTNWVGAKYKVNWWGKSIESGGPFNEQGTHLVDLCRMFMGNVIEVLGAGEREDERSDYYSTIAVTLRFTCGSLGSIFYSCLASEKQIDLRIFFPDRCIKLSGWDFRADEDDFSQSNLEGEDIFIKEDSAFFNAIVMNNPSLIQSPLQDAVRTQAVVDAINQSARINQPVLVSRQQ